MRENVMDGALSTHGRKWASAYMALVGKQKKPPGMFRHRWENNIKVDSDKYDFRLWAGSICFKIEMSGKLIRAQ
jgi:hypothetical protein